MTDASEGESDEDEAFNEHSSHCDAVVDWTGTVEPYNLICQVRIQAHGWCECDREVRKNAHKERAERRNRGSSSHEITVDLEQTERVGFVVETCWVDRVIANTCSTRVCEDGGLEVVVSLVRLYHMLII